MLIQTRQSLPLVLRTLTVTIYSVLLGLSCTQVIADVDFNEALFELSIEDLLAVDVNVQKRVEKLVNVPVSAST
ncbi:MAG: hypothetical protein HRT35_28960, partial [Algicola sp.]|nr:hypothetical protein [Algicola sp.]